MYQNIYNHGFEIGMMNNNRISLFEDFQLKSAVSNYPNDTQFIAYGEIILWIGDFGNSLPRRLYLNVLLTDNLDKIKNRIARHGQFVDIQLKSCTINKYTIPNKDHWNEGIMIKSEDTILSCQLYKNDRIILGRFVRQGVNNRC